MEDDGCIRLTPQLAKISSTGFYKSKKWKADEHQAEEYIQAGRVQKFNYVDDLMNDLESE